MRLLYNFGELSTDRIEIFRIKERPWLLHRFYLLDLCQDDREELSKVSPGNSIPEILAFCVCQENTYGVLFDGVPSLLFGFAPLPDGAVFLPWLLSDGRIQKSCPREFLRLARKIVNKVGSTGLPMYNCVPAETKRSTQWLTRLGFSFHSCTQRTLDGVPVRVFYMNATERE